MKTKSHSHCNLIMKQTARWPSSTILIASASILIVSALLLQPQLSIQTTETSSFSSQQAGVMVLPPVKPLDSIPNAILGGPHTRTSSSGFTPMIIQKTRLIATIAHPTHLVAGVCILFAAQAKVVPVNIAVAMTNPPKMTPSGVPPNVFDRKDGILRVPAMVICCVLSVLFLFLYHG
jgi:hypothetical protein